MSDNRTFVSYSRADSEFALKLAQDLRALGAAVWLDQLDIAAGARWDSAIEDGLRRSARVLVLLSPSSVASQNVLDEVSFAFDEGKTIVPVLVEACPVPLRLRRLQHVDFTSGYDAAMNRLLATLGVAQATASAATTPPPRSPVADEPPILTPPPAASRLDGRGVRVAIVAGAVVVVLVLGVTLWRPGGTTQPSPSPPADTGTAVETKTAAPPLSASPAPASERTSGSAPTTNAPESRPAASQRSVPANESPKATVQTFPKAAAQDGLQRLLALTQQLSIHGALTTEEMQGVADAQFKACPGKGASDPCRESASKAVADLAEGVCGRQAGPAPPESDSNGALKHDLKMLTCLQYFQGVLSERLKNNADGSIRRIKPG